MIKQTDAQIWTQQKKLAGPQAAWAVHWSLWLRKEKPSKWKHGKSCWKTSTNTESNRSARIMNQMDAKKRHGTTVNKHNKLCPPRTCQLRDYGTMAGRAVDTSPSGTMSHGRDRHKQKGTHTSTDKQNRMQVFKQHVLWSSQLKKRLKRAIVERVMMTHRHYWWHAAFGVRTVKWQRTCTDVGCGGDHLMKHAGGYISGGPPTWCLGVEIWCLSALAVEWKSTACP